jgi:hypothetical protein
MEKNQEWNLIPSAVQGCPLSIERGAYREIDDKHNEEVIYITAPQSFEWNETDLWRVSSFIDGENNGDQVDNIENHKPEEGTTLIKYFNTENEAVEYIKRIFKVDIDLKHFIGPKKGIPTN